MHAYDVIVFGKQHLRVYFHLFSKMRIFSPQNASKVARFWLKTLSCWQPINTIVCVCLCCLSGCSRFTEGRAGEDSDHPKLRQLGCGSAFASGARGTSELAGSQSFWCFIVVMFCWLSSVKVVEYILDRNACLLPAYFAVTEIRKLFPEGALSHWVIMYCFFL